MKPHHPCLVSSSVTGFGFTTIHKYYQFLHFCLSTYIITAIACLEIPSESNFNLPLFNASTYYIVIPYADHNLYKSGQNDDD